MGQTRPCVQHLGGGPVQVSAPGRGQVVVEGSPVKGVAEGERSLRVVRRPDDPPGGEQAVERCCWLSHSTYPSCYRQWDGFADHAQRLGQTACRGRQLSQSGQDGGIQAPRYRKFTVKREQSLLRYLPEESADVERMTTRMVAKSLSRSGRQRHARVTGHLEHILGCEAAQYHSAAPGVFNAEAVPTVVASGIRSRGHEHHHCVAFKPLRRG